MDTVRFTLQPADVRALDWFVWSRRRSLHLLAGLLLVLIGMQIVLGVPTLVDALRQGSRSDAFLQVLVLILPVVVLGLGFLFARMYAYHRLDRCIPGIYAPRIVQLQPAGIAVQEATGTATIAWHAITEIVARPEHVFLMLSRERGVIVPTRSFATAAAAQAFVDHAHRYWHAARSAA